MVKGTFKTTVLVADAVCLLLCVVAAWRLQGGPGVLATVVGNVVGLLNLFAMAWLIDRVVGTASSGGKSAYAGLFAFKLVAFVGVVALLLWALELQPLGLFIGFTGLIVAVLIGGFAAATAAKSTVPKGEALLP